MVAAHQSRQIEGLGGGVQRHGAHFRVLADGLGGDVAISGQQNVAPDLVGNHHDVVLFVQRHGLLDLPTLPDPAAGVVWGTENGGVDVIFHDLLFHVGKIHPPDTLLVLCQRRVDNVIAIVRQAVGKADVGRAVEQHVVPFGAQNVQRGDHAAQHAVFVADVFRLQAGDAVVVFLPADDGIVVFRRGVKVAEGRMLRPGDHGLLNGGNHGEIHVRDPHGNHVKALPGRGIGRTGRAHGVNGDGVLSPAIQNGSKVVFHCVSPLYALAQPGIPAAKIPRKTAAAQPPNRIIITAFPPFVNPWPPVSKGILCFPQL